LTQQLLTFAKGGTPVQKLTPLFPFVRETVLFALSGSNVSCRFDIPENLWPCNIDKNQIGQVIDNLVINAQQAMPMGGEIELAAGNIALDGKEHSVPVTGNYVKISIKDHGIGIPWEFQPRIFDPFFTTKTQGHGLGLATCHSIVNRHGGYIDVESEPGKGSTFHVYLPAVTETVAAAAAETRVIHVGSGMILIMDDEEVMRDIIASMVKALGYTPVCTRNGTEMLNRLAEESRANRVPAAMIIDLTVPGGMGGKDTVKAVREMSGTIPIFVASGYADDPIMKNPSGYGFTASISKPFRKAELAEMLNRHLSRP
jgi:two-component system, cell cycle sensor histidine kinase and response regulator CckA